MADRVRGSHASMLAQAASLAPLPQVVRPAKTNLTPEHAFASRCVNGVRQAFCSVQLCMA